MSWSGWRPSAPARAPAASVLRCRARSHVTKRGTARATVGACKSSPTTSRSPGRASAWRPWSRRALGRDLSRAARHRARRRSGGPRGGAVARAGGWPARARQALVPQLEAQTGIGRPKRVACSRRSSWARVLRAGRSSAGGDQRAAATSRPRCARASRRSRASTFSRIALDAKNQPLAELTIGIGGLDRVCDRARRCVPACAAGRRSERDLRPQPPSGDPHAQRRRHRHHGATVPRGAGAGGRRPGSCGARRPGVLQLRRCRDCCAGMALCVPTP